jgi:hypothetical protein
MDINRITSIGWLYGVNQTIILTPCIDGMGHATKVTITAAQFAAIKHDKNLMKQKAAEMIP